MSWKKTLEAKDTEEVRPGIFIQKYWGPLKNYKVPVDRVVNPLVWKGEWRLNKQFRYRNLITIAVVLFLAFTYINETQFCRDLQENPCEILPNITNYCTQINTGGIAFGEESDTFTLQNNP